MVDLIKINPILVDIALKVKAKLAFVQPSLAEPILCGNNSKIVLIWEDPYEENVKIGISITDKNGVKLFSKYFQVDSTVDIAIQFEDDHKTNVAIQDLSRRIAEFRAFKMYPVRWS